MLSSLPKVIQSFLWLRLSALLADPAFFVIFVWLYLVSPPPKATTDWQDFTLNLDFLMQ